MDRLPPEIILNICRELCAGKDYFPDNIVDLKSLRLCSREFAGPAAEFLFVDVSVFLNHRSLDKLKAIAEHPIYRKKVEIMTFFGHMVAGELVTKEDYETDIRGMTFDGPQHEDWGFDDNGKRLLSKEAIDDGHSNYLKILNEQTEAFQGARLQLPKILPLFVHLRGIQSYSVHAYFQYGILEEEPAQIHQIARQTLSPLAGRLWTSIPLVVEDMTCICEAAAKVKGPLEWLYLDGYIHPFSGRILDTAGVELEHVSKAVLLSRRVVLAFAATDEEWFDDVPVNRHDACGFLDDGPSLEELAIVTPGHHIFFDIGCLFSPINWPVLRSLTIFFWDQTCAFLSLLEEDVSRAVVGRWFLARWLVV